ncbi:hypothetical protein ACFQ0B_11820 [Nonomuraea thailandensis]
MLELALSEGLPRLGFQAPCPDLVVPGVAGQLPSRPKARGGGRVLPQVDVAGRRKQRQPTACHEETTVLSESLPAVEEARHVLQMPPYAAKELRRWCARVIGCQVVYGKLKPFQRLSTDVAGRRPAGKLDRVDLVAQVGRSFFLVEERGLTQPVQTAVQLRVLVVRSVLAAFVIPDPAHDALRLRELPVSDGGQLQGEVTLRPASPGPLGA